MSERGRLDQVARESGGRIIAYLAASFRDLDLAEEAFAEACARAVTAWTQAEPRDPAAWLYATARRHALDMIRKRMVRQRLVPEPPAPQRSAEDRLVCDDALIPDERLKLILVCCHPVVASEARAALTLRLVCGLSVQEIARAFLVSEPALFQRLTRAKKKIAQAGATFEVPGPLARAADRRGRAPAAPRRRPGPTGAPPAAGGDPCGVVRSQEPAGPAALGRGAGPL